jgi:hypothetical protein
MLKLNCSVHDQVSRSGWAIDAFDIAECLTAVFPYEHSVTARMLVQRRQISHRNWVQKLSKIGSKNGFTTIRLVAFFAEFFAELRATEAPKAPFVPLYSVENTRTPSLVGPLLTDRL